MENIDKVLCPYCKHEYAHTDDHDILDCQAQAESMQDALSEYVVKTPDADSGSDHECKFDINEGYTCLECGKQGDIGELIDDAEIRCGEDR